MWEKLILLKENKTTVITLSTDITDNITVKLYLDDDHWKNKSQVRFIEWNYYIFHNHSDLNLGIVGEVGDMFVTISNELLHILPHNIEIELVIDVKITSVDEFDSSILKIVDARDYFVFKIINSDIHIVMNGHNQAYGNTESILIDASATYDPDIEGMHYYLPFEFEWKCPEIINATIWSMNFPIAGKTYSLSLHASSLIQAGLAYDEYYEFKAIAKREAKTTEYPFYVKIVNERLVPKIKIEAIQEGIYSLRLFANIEVTEQILGVQWFYMTSNNQKIMINHTHNYELEINKKYLQNENIDRVFAKILWFEESKSSIINAEGFYKLFLSDISNIQPNQKVPSSRTISYESTEFYKLISIQVDNLPSRNAVLNFNFKSIDSNGEINPISEWSISDGVLKYYIKADTVEIETDICMITKLGWIYISTQLKSQKPPTNNSANISTRFVDLLNHYLLSLDYEQDNGFINVLLDGILTYIDFNDSLIVDQVRNIP